ncbi:MAG: archaemetzincin [Nibricoccus sp.]
MKSALWITLVAIFFQCACHGFEPPSALERDRALGSLENENPVLQKLFSAGGDFEPIRAPGLSDWLESHEEKGQSYAAYMTSGFNRPDSKRNVIYIQPLGDFPADTSPSLEHLRVYAEAFFQLDVKILPTASIDPQKFSSRINGHTQKEQLLTGSIIAFLKTQLPSDAYCLIGVTMADLYPAKSWNYVFGQASLTGRVGIYSFARYDPAFFGQPRSSDYKEMILRRSCKVLAHETAHMFGLPHCIYYQCLLNGANNLDEADTQPQHVCPICLRKLHFNIQFDPVVRYEELSKFYKAQGWETDACWIERQLEKAKAP